mgnify:CR=1 FL=1
MTNAERQAAYRKRHLSSEAGECVRADLVINQSASLAFDRLAQSFSLSKRQTVEHLLLLAEAAVLAGLNSNGRKRYFAGIANLNFENLKFVTERGT